MRCSSYTSYDFGRRRQLWLSNDSVVRQTVLMRLKIMEFHASINCATKPAANLRPSPAVPSRPQKFLFAFDAFGLSYFGYT